MHRPRRPVYVCICCSASPQSLYVLHSFPYCYTTDLYSDLTSYSYSSSCLFMFQQLLYSIIYITSGILLASYCKHVVYVIHYVLYCTSVKGHSIYVEGCMYVCTRSALLSITLSLYLSQQLLVLLLLVVDLLFIFTVHVDPVLMLVLYTVALTVVVQWCSVVVYSQYAQYSQPTVLQEHTCSSVTLSIHLSTHPL